MFNKKTLLKMLEYSSESYKNIQPEVNGVEILTIDDKKTDVQCYIRKFERETCITFRGSSSQKDFKTDLKFWRKSIPYNNNLSKIRVHRGFINAYKCHNIRDKIHKIIENNINNIDKIIVTGHSYGAALAILCAVDIQYNFPRKDYEVYLFGSPRVGNKAFADSYNKRIFKTFRLVNGNDIVTKIPLSIMGYRHVGMCIHIGRPRLFGLFSTSEHSLSKYYLNILKSIL